MFPDLHCRQVPDDGEEPQEEVGLLSLQASSGPNKSSTSLLVNMVCVSFYYWRVQQNPYCFVRDFGKKHVVSKAIRKPSSFAAANVMFFFWEHLLPQAPPEPEEDGLDDEQREVDMEKNEPVDIDGTGLLT